MAQVDVTVRAQAIVGEGPVWQPETGVLHWVDIPQGTIFSSVPGSSASAGVQLPWSVGAVALDRDGGLVFAGAAGFGLITDDGYDLRLPFSRPGERMNDAKVDPAGRFWAGSTAVDFRAGAGALHVVDGGWTHRVARTGFTLPNGLDWSPDGTEFYLADSYQRAVYAYPFDLEDGALGAPRTVLSLDDADGVPDGLTVDADGCLWIAIWGGGRLIRVAPTGELLTTVPMPVRQPSSCAFGGPGLDVLFVTSARDGLDLPDDAVDGSVFEVTGLDVSGLAASRFAAGRSVEPRS
jgi:sugar lactone lactonase YvrE